MHNTKKNVVQERASVVCEGVTERETYRDATQRSTMPLL